MVDIESKIVSYREDTDDYRLCLTRKEIDEIKNCRANAINEFVKAIEKHQTRQDSHLEPPYIEMGLDMTDVLEVAYELKERRKI